MTRALFLIIVYIQICSNFLFFLYKSSQTHFFLLIYYYCIYLKISWINTKRKENEELITIKKFLFNFIFK